MVLYDINMDRWKFPAVPLLPWAASISVAVDGAVGLSNQELIVGKTFESDARFTLHVSFADALVDIELLLVCNL